MLKYSLTWDVAVCLGSSLLPGDPLVMSCFDGDWVHSEEEVVLFQILSNALHFTLPEAMTLVHSIVLASVLENICLINT